MTFRIVELWVECFRGGKGIILLATLPHEYLRLHMLVGMLSKEKRNLSNAEKYSHPKVIL